MRICVIGQSAFGASVYSALVQAGFTVCGVFAPLDANGRVDPLAAAAEKDGVPYFKVEKWRALKKDGGKVLPDVWEKYSSVKADLNILAYVTQFIPMEVIDAPSRGSIIYHPSLLPRHRGASAISWALMQGDAKTGLTVFWADDGLDTGPILLQREVTVELDDTLSGLYKRFLFPQGVEALVEAAGLIRDGRAPRIPQPPEGASYEELWTDKKKAKINWDQPGRAIHNFIRGSDRVPGAWTTIAGQEVTFYDSHFIGTAEWPAGRPITIDGVPSARLVQTGEGIVFAGTDGAQALIKTVQIGKTQTPAKDFK